MSNRTYSRNAFETNLDGAITNSATSFAVDAAAGLTAPVYLVIDPDDPAKREFIKVGSINVNTLQSVTRGLDGSASGAQAHDSGAVVRAVPVHQWLDDIFTDIETLETADTDHFGGTDTSDHPEATTSVRGFMSAADKTKLDGIATGAVADHGDLAGLSDDDHSQYLTTGRHAAIDAAEHGSGAATANQLLQADGAGGAAWATVDHGTLAGTGDDDHSQYLNAARHDARDHSAALATSSLADLGTRAHDLLTGLGDDDHPQYLNSARHDNSEHSGIDHHALTGLGDNDHPQYLLRSGGTMASHLDPDSDNARDLGDASTSWRRLYAYSLYDESGNPVLDLSQTTFFHGGTAIFDMRRASNGMQLRNAAATGSYFEIDDTNNWFQWALQNTEILRASGQGVYVQGNRGLGYSTTPTLDGGVGDFTAYWDDDVAEGWKVGTTASDQSLKENVRDFEGDPTALFRVPLRTYEIRAEMGGHRVGETKHYLVADELETVAPHLVTVHDGLKRIKDGQPMQAHIIAALQDLNDRLVAAGI